MLYGRDAELSAIEDLLAGAREGKSGALLVRGEAGIGKTALLDHAEAVATGLRVIRGAGVESEAELPFAALHLLLRPVLDRVGALPGVQATALRAALGLVPAADSGDWFLVGLAVLSLLSDLAEDRPVLCLIDDAQGLDRASAGALLFAARRLDAEGVVMVFAARDGERGFAAHGLPELRLDGLDARAAAGLLGEYGEDLGPDVRRRVLSEAAGNPLGLIELPKALGESHRVGERVGGQPRGVPQGILPLTDRLREAFQGQVERLPETARALLLVAALEDTGDLGVILAAAERSGASLDDLDVAERAGLVRTGDGGVRFRHPLLRAAVVDGSPLGTRVAAHAALATTLDRPADADRRAWHLAAAATGPDERVAAELERTAVRAKRRSGYSAAASAYERAARLTPHTGPQERRLALAAEAAAESGELDRAAGLAEQAAGLTTDPALRARLTEIRAAASFWAGSLGAAYRLLMEGAELVSAADPHRTASMLIEAAHIGWYTGERELTESLERLAAVPLAAADPLAPMSRLLMLATSPTVGWAVTGAAAEDARADSDELIAVARAAAGDPADLILVAAIGLILGQDTVTLELASALAAETREQGRIGLLPQMLFYLSSAQQFIGRHGDALATATEALGIARDTGQRQWAQRLGEPLAHLAAFDGDEALCRRLTDDALARVTTGDPSWEVPWVYSALGVLDLGLGRAEAALARLTTLEQGRARFHIAAIRSTPDLVEAAVRVGGPDAATEAFGQFEKWAVHARQPWIDALTLRCRALLAPAERAADHFEAALRLHAKASRPFDHARTALLYGEWLRRARRKAEARTHLRTALEAFERLGAKPWSERARTELGATGTTAPRQPAPGALAGLTPQELQIVRLAARGLSNREIAAQLFLSPRTVGYHLYKAYPKLGVASRGELAAVLTTVP
ncbi:LuxR family transcriptional regulator [Actinomadura sp. HBU206391]|uniref:LuxR family transcriptional regulator n=1 Tax=Actinomadura sp. HBU206391 TaxID=2731692 RepID=UPI00164FDC4E|nr:LuxR family transcriptional regulator [Actinomadura sp. HBU206391]MBC6456399.1 AAA family ATPase [Actinomadura sp. HBU206391]